MYKDTLEYCKSCPQCATVSGSGRPGRPPLQSIPVRRPFQIIVVDVMDLPKTELGNKHVLVFQDFLSKWPLVFPIPDQKTHIPLSKRSDYHYSIFQRTFYLTGVLTCFLS